MFSEAKIRSGRHKNTPPFMETEGHFCLLQIVSTFLIQKFMTPVHTLKYSAAAARFTTVLQTISSLSHANITRTLKHGKGFSHSYKMQCTLRNSEQYKLRHSTSHKSLQQLSDIVG